MGVLAPGSAHARPSARPPIDVNGNLSAHWKNKQYQENQEKPCIGLYHYVFLASRKFSGNYMCLARTLLRPIHPGWELTIQFISFTFDHPVLGQVNNIGHCILPLWPREGISLGPTKRIRDLEISIFFIQVDSCITGMEARTPIVMNRILIILYYFVLFAYCKLTKWSNYLTAVLS